MTIFQPHDNDPGQNVAEKKRFMSNRYTGRVLNDKDCAGGRINLLTTGNELESTTGLWSRLRASFFFSPSCGKRNRQIYKIPQRLLKLLTLLYASSTGVLATPIHGGQDSGNTQTTHRFYARDLNERTWIPIVVICVAAALLFFCTHPRGRSTLASFAAHVRTPHDSATTELTAEQLAGSINNAGTANNNNSNGNNANTTTTRPRRTRRPRRTPSQISTHSLPAYAKEPGEQELVVLQGIQDMEDAPIHQPRATVVNLDEEGEESADGHHGPTRYTPIPESPAQTPLLQDDDPSGILSAQDLPVTDFQVQGRSSGDTGHDSTGTTSLVGIESHDPELQSRGEAPAYFEVIEQGSRGDIATPSRGFIDAGPHNAPVNATPETMTFEVVPPPPTPSAPSEVAVQQRRSGFRSLLGRMSITTGTTSTHARNDSATSAASSSLSHHTHVRGTSGSILSPFRTLSRQKSITSHNSSRVNLTSPSLISLNSISAPLTHTAVRTEFTYPKSGPTPEQIKFISSRESLARFGLPYGPDAMAFAASVSRIDLAGVEERPPEFEEVVGGDGVGASTSADAGQSLGLAGERSGEMQEVSLVGERSQILEDVPEAGPSVVVGPRPTLVDGLPVEREAVDDLVLTGAASVVASSGGVGAKGIGGAAEQVDKEKLEGNSEGTEVRLKDVQSIQALGTVKTDAVEGMTPSASVPPTAGASTSPEPIVPLTTEGQQHSLPLSLSTPTLPHTDPSPQSQSTLNTTDQLHASAVTAETQSSIPSLGRTTKAAIPPPSSYHLPPQSQGTSLQRPESRASQMSSVSYASYASDITFQTAAESLSSRRGRRANLSGDDDEDGHSDSGDSGGGGGGGGGGGYSDDDEVGRPSTPTLGEESLRSRKHGRESTDATVVPTKQERHFSIMTVTHA